jgi:hypothetical protein
MHLYERRGGKDAAPGRVRERERRNGSNGSIDGNDTGTFHQVATEHETKVL